jgi:hypothetical protein
VTRRLHAAASESQLVASEFSQSESQVLTEPFVLQNSTHAHMAS